MPPPDSEDEDSDDDGNLSFGNLDKQDSDLLSMMARANISLNQSLQQKEENGELKLELAELKVEMAKIQASVLVPSTKPDKPIAEIKEAAVSPAAAGDQNWRQLQRGIYTRRFIF